MQKLLSSLERAFPNLRFTPSKTFYWSPESHEVFYNATSPTEQHVWSLLHETGHGLLDHKTYTSDVELLKMEVAAWDKAVAIATQFDVTIEPEHIQDCLDTYRDWLNARSICPSCTTKCLQQSDMRHYRCHNCHTTWKVTLSRFCRAYRSVKNTAQPEVVFAAEI